jgi:DNA-binding NarL/FixJ family response regulator
VDSPRINILIVDDHAVVREGLKYILSTADNLTVIGEAGNAPDTMASLRKHPCDLVLLDLSLPGKTGVDTR